MNWEAVGAVAEIAGALAVLITLIYLARQISQSNRQDLLLSFQNTFDALNAWCVMVSESADLAPIVLKGRESYAALDDAERLRFDHVHIHLLNIIESHHFQVHQTAIDEGYRRWAIENLEGIAAGYLGFPGTKEFWSGAEAYYPDEVRKLVTGAIGGASEPGPDPAD